MLKMVGGVGGFYVSTRLLLDAASLTDFLDPEKYSHATARRFHKPDMIVVNKRTRSFLLFQSRVHRSGDSSAVVGPVQLLRESRFFVVFVTSQPSAWLSNLISG